MGMFDSLYDDRGNKWQTKAYGCNLDEWKVGDKMPRESGGGTAGHPLVDPLPDAYQVAIFGGARDAWDSGRDAWATVLAHVLIEIGVGRDPNLPAVDYYGGPAMGGRP